MVCLQVQEEKHNIPTTSRVDNHSNASPRRVSLLRSKHLLHLHLQMLCHALCMGKPVSPRMASLLRSKIIFKCCAMHFAWARNRHVSPRLAALLRSKFIFTLCAMHFAWSNKHVCFSKVSCLVEKHKHLPSLCHALCMVKHSCSLVGLYFVEYNRCK